MLWQGVRALGGIALTVLRLSLMVPSWPPPTRKRTPRHHRALFWAIFSKRFFHLFGQKTTSLPIFTMLRLPPCVCCCYCLVSGVPVLPSGVLVTLSQRHLRCPRARLASRGEGIRLHRTPEGKHNIWSRMLNSALSIVHGGQRSPSLLLTTRVSKTQRWRPWRRRGSSSKTFYMCGTT